MNPERDNWWWSGRFWYCSVDGPNGTKSGAGETRQKAEKDARIESWKRPRYSTRTSAVESGNPRVCDAAADACENARSLASR